VALNYLTESNKVFRDKNIKYGLILVHESLAKAEVDPKEMENVPGKKNQKTEGDLVPGQFFPS
jgi:hypothetical protein